MKLIHRFRNAHGLALRITYGTQSYFYPLNGGFLQFYLLLPMPVLRLQRALKVIAINSFDISLLRNSPGPLNHRVEANFTDLLWNLTYEISLKLVSDVELIFSISKAELATKYLGRI